MKRAASLVLGLIVTLVVAEAAMRLIRPRPRVQIVDPAHAPLVFEPGDPPLWWARYEAGPVRPLHCDDGPAQVIVAGDSVFHAITVDALDAKVAFRLADALGCVIDVTSSGYLPYQQLASAKRAHARFGGEVVVAVVWKPSVRLVRFGPVWAEAERLETDASGFPLPPLPVPDAVHHGLVQASALWRYATLAITPPEDEPAPRPLEQDYVALLDWAEGEDLSVVLVEAPALNQPFAVTADTREHDLADWMRRLEARAAAGGHAYVVLAERLRGLDVEAVRLDTCCHYNGDGHAAVAQAILPDVRAALAQERAL